MRDELRPWATAKLEILDIAGFWYAPRDEEPNDPHARKGLLEYRQSSAVMRARCQHVIEEPDHLRSRIAEDVVN